VNVEETPQQPAQVQIRVSDDGTGMSQETLSHVFEPFFTTKKEGEGTGLGLASAYGIITGAGGTIEIDSALGVGTTVTITLPASDARALVPIQESEGTAPRIGRGEMILLVEDDEELRTAVQRMLTNNDFEVVAATDGEMALELLRAHAEDEFAVLITDMVMPKMLGRDLVERAKEQQSDIRVLYMSGYAASTLAEATVVDATSTVLKKPFGEKVLLETLRSVLEAAPLSEGRGLGSRQVGADSL
jgi:CheY-like chemotaxis protein